MENRVWTLTQEQTGNQIYFPGPYGPILEENEKSL